MSKNSPEWSPYLPQGKLRSCKGESRFRNELLDFYGEQLQQRMERELLQWQHQQQQQV